MKKVRHIKFAKEFPSSAFCRRAIDSQGKPWGNWKFRTGQGPKLFAQGALEKLEQGGVLITIWKFGSLVHHLSCSAMIDRSPDPSRSRSTSVISRVQLRSWHFCFNQKRMSPLRAGPEKKYMQWTVLLEPEVKFAVTA
jgi:hypothetical protein